jgi:hypothetical protein
LLAQRGLRHHQRGGGFAETAGFGNGDEILKAAQVDDGLLKMRLSPF